MEHHFIIDMTYRFIQVFKLHPLPRVVLWQTYIFVFRLLWVDGMVAFWIYYSWLLNHYNIFYYKIKHPFLLGIVRVETQLMKQIVIN